MNKALKRAENKEHTVKPDSVKLE